MIIVVQDLNIYIIKPRNSSLIRYNNLYLYLNGVHDK